MARRRHAGFPGILWNCPWVPPLVRQRRRSTQPSMDPAKEISCSERRSTKTPGPLSKVTAGCARPWGAVDYGAAPETPSLTRALISAPPMSLSLRLARKRLRRSPIPSWCRSCPCCRSAHCPAARRSANSDPSFPGASSLLVGALLPTQCRAHPRNLTSRTSASDPRQLPCGGSRPPLLAATQCLHHTVIPPWAHLVSQATAILEFQKSDADM